MCVCPKYERARLINSLYLRKYGYGLYCYSIISCVQLCNPGSFSLSSACAVLEGACVHMWSLMTFLVWWTIVLPVAHLAVPQLLLVKSLMASKLTHTYIPVGRVPAQLLSPWYARQDKTHLLTVCVGVGVALMHSWRYLHCTSNISQHSVCFDNTTTDVCLTE